MLTQFYHYPSNGVFDSSATVRGHSLNETFQCYWVCPNGLRCNDLIHGHNLSAHLRDVHGVRGSDRSRVSCHWWSCNKEVNKESLVRHVEETHMGIVYPCDLCGAAFSRKDTLTRHTRACTGQR